MKKLIVLLLALGIVGAFVGGCASAEDDTAPATTTGTTDDTGTDGE